MPRKNARIDAFVLKALRLNPKDPWAEKRAVIAGHRMHARAARQQARYDVDALETAAYHDAEAERLEAELEAAGHKRPRGARYRKNPDVDRIDEWVTIGSTSKPWSWRLSEIGPSHHGVNPRGPFDEHPGDWVEIEDAAYDAHAPAAYVDDGRDVDDWVTIEECACSSCTPMRLNPPKRKATGAYADLDSIMPVIAEALAKHGLTLDGLDGGAEGVKFTRGGKSRAGSCSYSPSLRKCKIMFNGLAWPAFTEEQRLNTVLHEAAHAIQFLTTGRSDHGPAWQRIARSIGCTGDKCMSVEASQAMVDAYAEARGLPKRKVVTRESAMEASADFAVGDYVSFEHKRERWYGKITGKDAAHARVMVQQPATRVGITGKIPYPLLQKEAPPRHAEKVAGVDKPAPGESLSAWQARTGRGVR